MSQNRIKMGNWEFTDQELKLQLDEAAERGKVAERTEARASQVYYDGNYRRLIIELRNRVLLGIPVDRIQGLANAPASEIAKVQLEPSGDAVRWDALDLDFSIPGLVAGVLGTNAWMAELGRKGGSTQSDAKAAAARLNGLCGGRPAQTRTVIVTPRYSVISKPVIVSTEEVRPSFNEAYWGRYRRLVDVYKALREGRYAYYVGTGVPVRCNVSQKETFSRVSGNIRVYHASEITEAQNSADLALAA